MYQFKGRAYNLDEDENVTNEIKIDVDAENETEALEKVKPIVSRQYYEFREAREIKIVD